MHDSQVHRCTKAVCFTSKKLGFILNHCVHVIKFNPFSAYIGDFNCIPKKNYALKRVQSQENVRIQ